MISDVQLVYSPIPIPTFSVVLAAFSKTGIGRTLVWIANINLNKHLIFSAHLQIEFILCFASAAGPKRKKFSSAALNEKVPDNLKKLFSNGELQQTPAKDEGWIPALLFRNVTVKTSLMQSMPVTYSASSPHVGQHRVLQNKSCVQRRKASRSSVSESSTSFHYVLVQTLTVVWSKVTEVFSFSLKGRNTTESMFTQMFLSKNLCQLTSLIHVPVEICYFYCLWQKCMHVRHVSAHFWVKFQMYCMYCVT